VIKLFSAATCILPALFLTVHPIQAWGAEPGSGVEPFTPVIGYSSSTFTYVVKENAQAAAKLWSNLVIKKKKGIAETRIYNGCSDMEKDLVAGKVDLVVLRSNEYLELKNRALLEPLFISARGQELYDNFILLVRRESGIHSIKELRGKSFIQQAGNSSEIHRIWFETLMLKEGVHDQEHYFSSIKEVMSPSQALMPVFFKSADACILSRRSFEVMAELNPQLHKDLTVIAESRPLATGVIAVRKDYNNRHREMLKEVLETLDQDVQGRQLLTLFRMTSLVPYRQVYLQSMGEFLKEYHELKAKTRKR
jgi:phosphonate transport system substrate-binding protein